MITLRRADERRHDQRGKREVWLTFFPSDHAPSPADSFGTLELLNETRLPPGGSIPRRRSREAEIVTYVREGALTFEDSTGRSGVVQAGEFQRMTTGRRLRHREGNASRTHWAHIFRVSLCPSQADLEPGHEQRRFSTAERRGALRVVASPDARRGSLPIHQDGLVYSALLDPGQHVAHELAPGRDAWLHLVQGEVTLGGDVVLTTGDGAGFSGERAVSLTALEETELLLLDLRQIAF